MADKLPPHITVQHFTKEQREQGLVPSASQPKSPEHVTFQNPVSGSPPTTEPDSVGETPVTSDESKSAPPDEAVNVDVTGDPDDLPIESSDVQVKGLAAIAVANMLGLTEVWDITTGEPMPLSQAKLSPQLAVIDFDALVQSTEGLDESAIGQLMDAIPEKKSQIQNQRSARAWTQQPAGPGVTVKHIPGLVRVEVEGPVKLQKAKEGNVRILQVKYQTVEAPTGAAKATKVTTKGSAVRLGQTHQVQMRNAPKPPARTVPRMTEPVDEEIDTEEF